MRKCSFALLLLSACAWTQKLPIDNPDDPIVAVVNGRKLKASEYKKMAEAQDPAMRALAVQQPKAFLEQYALYEAVLAAAEKEGLDQQNPFKEKLAMTRRQILVSGYIDEHHKMFTVPEAQAKKFYEGNKDLYNQAIVNVIFISKASQTMNVGDGKVLSTVTPEENKEKAEKAAKLIREGAPFGRIAKEYSDDAESAKNGGAFPHPIRPSSANVPANIRTPILAAKAGDILGPIEHDTGFYIFQVVSIGLAPFDQVKADIVKEMKDAELKHWIDGFKKNSSVAIENESALTEALKAR